VKDPDEEDGNQRDHNGPEEYLTLINFSVGAVVIVITLYKIGFESEQEKPNNDTDYKEPKQVEPPTVSSFAMMMMFTLHTMI